MAVMAEATQRTDLSDLVRNRREELGLSLRQAEAASAVAGDQPRVKYGWLGKLEKNAPNLDVPTLTQLQGLAVALRLPLQAVKDHAAAQFFDIESDQIWSTTAEASVVVARMNELSVEDRKALAEMVELFARSRTTREAPES